MLERCGFRFLGSAVVLVCILVVRPANGQELSDDEIIRLGEAAEAMEARGVNPDDPDSIAIIAEELEARAMWRSWVSSWEVRELARESREDREFGRLASAVRGPGQMLMIQFGRRTLTCGEAKAKAEKLWELQRALTEAAWMYGIGGGLMAGVAGSLASRFVPPIAFAGFVTSVASTTAGWLATQYNNAPCLAASEKWFRKPTTIRA
jgi:hypothetical protein